MKFAILLLMVACASASVYDTKSVVPVGHHAVQVAHPVSAVAPVHSGYVRPYPTSVVSPVWGAHHTSPVWGAHHASPVVHSGLYGYRVPIGHHLPVGIPSYGYGHPGYGHQGYGQTVLGGYGYGHHGYPAWGNHYGYGY